MRRLFVVPVVLVLLATACSNKEQAADSSIAADAGSSASRGEAMQAAPDAGGAVAPAAPSAPPAEPKSAVTGPGVDPDAMGSAAMTQNVGTRRFIRTAQVEAQVRDVQRAAVRIADLAASQGGFVTRDDISTAIDRVETRPLGNERLVELSTYTMRGDLEVRVPSDRAQMFLRSVAGELEFLDRRHYEAVDAQFELLRRELARKRHEQAQAVLGDAAANAGKTADKIDAIEGRADQQTQRDEALVEQRTYEDRVEFATLDFSLRQPQQVRRAERPDVDAILRHERPNLFSRLGTAMADGGRGLLDLVVMLVAGWPLWLGLAVALIGVRAWRRRAK
ncbi:DUF4349 domain-containing protein [Cognatilysobacter terrigena]|uniref:DUF4349 domain-containing protein n=1 Tax=Cognatilysobacter terrigena TaxID=2488749 RepID=UPI00105BEE7F|nr:DUF4349 domain-containing protein [Lysobacter terrigena]